MGRAFEYRKARKMKRWGQMAKTFTRIGKDIVIAVKAGGPDPDTNGRLRAIIQNAKAANMPKENVERAIKKASSKEQEDYKEIVYEGYAPHGVGLVIETATDNLNRTVANIRSYLNKLGGSLGTQGMLDFMFTRKSVFRIAAEGIDMEELELELIDLGADELELDEETNQIVIYGDFTAFGALQKYLEEKGYELKGAEFERIPTDYKELTDEQVADVEKLIERIEEDDDVQMVYHNMR
ncbi:YebC/PmpR family DNA-binding transcriptional regulator [Fibrivirga algicola]|uniref:Probable transcriptional regulatory protein F7231_13180 n=1 Tax=Fibrivirga algicola TaxID=2950420 RepID=A0ABX0QGE7_9BACT|nr:YebC/PmpR family DNA-binding transcriptional regulator [Fibrivirga algicola]ARK12045.1 transcriptional regulator [Fibrella sp. ES10-3-2-2]NID11127.1 YebC/PmpR family DNA-binding transcriptional regulator [Fibrivirga algicola]